MILATLYIQGAEVKVRMTQKAFDSLYVRFETRWEGVIKIVTPNHNEFSTANEFFAVIPAQIDAIKRSDR